MSKWEKNEEIQIFREYLRIPSVHPDPDYEPCIEFLKKQAQSLDLPFEVIYPSIPTKPVFILKWLGSDPSLSSVMLNSHMDVVPVFEENWKYPPFAAEMDEDGKIYARGTQDMKSVGTQYLGALRALRKANFVPKRTIYVTFVPDEEIRSKHGMGEFVKTDTFKNMNVGVSLDEGAASGNHMIGLFYGERILWHFNFIITGSTGHGSLLIKNTAGEKLTFLLNKINDFRNGQIQMLSKLPHPLYFQGDVTTVNLTKISGGVQANVIPSKIEMSFDCRISPKQDLMEFEKKLHQWCEEAGEGVELVFNEKDEFVPISKMDTSNPFWLALKQTFDQEKIEILPVVCPGNTDGRFLRSLGIPVFGMSPITDTPVLLHDHNEYISAEVYLKGIEFYTKVIPSLANV